MKITIELDLLEVARITDALDMWKENIPNVFEEGFHDSEREHVNMILTKIDNAISDKLDNWDYSCKHCGLVNGH